MDYKGNMNNTNSTHTENEMLTAAVAAIRSKLAIDAIKGHDTAETGQRFLTQMRNAGVPDMVARLVIMQALGR
jgi:hypothetical protein